MKMAARPMLALVVALGASSARAEGYLSSPYAHRPVLATAGWELAVPVMSLRSNFIDARSLAGLRLGMRFEAGDRLSIGADVGWNRFRQDTALGDQLRMDVVTLRATVHYYFGGSDTQPYLGAGLGGLYREAVLNAGPTQAGWGALGGPELGLLLVVGEGLAIDLAVRYEITTASFDVNGNPAWHVKYPAWLGAHVGFAAF